MKFEHVMLLIKGWLITSIAGVGAFGAGLSQLKVEKLFGLPIQVLELLCGVYSTAGAAALGFISTSFGDFVAKRASNGNTQQFVLGQPTGQPSPAPKP